MVKIEGKRDSLVLFFVFFFLPSLALFLISGSNNLSEWISTSFYLILTIGCLVVLGTIVKSDDEYYRNLSLPYFLSAVIVGLAMIGLSWFLSIEVFGEPSMLLSVQRSFPFPNSETGTLALTPIATSVGTMFLSTILYGLIMAATSEELFKLSMFAEGKKRWGDGYKIGRLTIPGVLVYVGFPVGFWAALHGIQAYDNPIMILPAFVNGVVLIIYLWKTQCVLGCIFAHWIYNSGVTLLTYLNGLVSIPSGTPLFPNPFNPAYYSNSGFIHDFLLMGLFVGVTLFFLVPSLTNKKK